MTTAFCRLTLPSGLKLRAAKFDVVRLPSQRGQTHIYERFCFLVDAAALVVQAFESERVEHLDLVLVFEINAAVAPSLSAGVRHEGGAELDMQQKILEAVPSNGRHSEQVTFLNFADRPGVGVRSVKEHDRAGGGTAPSVGDVLSIFFKEKGTLFSAVPLKTPSLIVP